jgi:hypothetical protein
MKTDANHLLFVIDITGTLVFAVEGAQVIGVWRHWNLPRVTGG